MQRMILSFPPDFSPFLIANWTQQLLLLIWPMTRMCVFIVQVFNAFKFYTVDGKIWSAQHSIELILLISIPPGHFNHAFLLGSLKTLFVESRLCYKSRTVPCLVNAGPGHINLTSVSTLRERNVCFMCSLWARKGHILNDTYCQSLRRVCWGDGGGGAQKKIEKTFYRPISVTYAYVSA